MAKQRDIHDSIVVVTPPTEEPLSVAEVKTARGLTYDAFDAQIEPLIPVARHHAEVETARAIAVTTYRYTLDEFPDDGSFNEIRLPNPPLQSVDGFSYVGVDGVERELTPDDFTVDFDSEPARVSPAFGRRWPATREQPGAVRITFTAGYPPGESGSGESTVPASIRQAMMLMIGHWLENTEATGERQVYEIPFGARALLAMNSWGAL